MSKLQLLPTKNRVGRETKSFLTYFRFPTYSIKSATRISSKRFLCTRPASPRNLANPA